MRALTWLAVLTAGLDAHAGVAACYDASAHALYAVECTEYDEAGTECERVRYALRDGGVTALPKLVTLPDGGTEAVAEEAGEIPPLPDAGCAPLRRVDLAKRLTVEVLDKGPVADLNRPDPEEPYPLRWPRRDVALKAGPTQLGRYTLLGINQDGMRVEGYDAGDHRHALLVIYWKAHGNEGSTDDRESRALVGLDVSGYRTAPEDSGFFGASVRFDRELDEVLWREVTAAALKKKKAPTAAKWADSARAARTRYELRHRPDFIAMDEVLRAFDWTPPTLASPKPTVLRVVLKVYQYLEKVPAAQRELAVELLAHPIAKKVFENPTHWPVQLNDRQSEVLTRTATGFLHSDGRPVDLGD